ncbi:DUF2752 domain-containing protein [Catenuloplanes atrovinosus]|uniref:DUF2752 domain-containing protein n=1 Tax=Catenuloplanes atrovinosus TaxID=137266 RepID=A0AAE3YIM9_9ACTN|nr:DUF2752 domain-containing protein [Catenuloplanes atrovinosus]MDR7274429.1 hypothetical protein [Catenuloplanes atrovinosus]
MNVTARYVSVPERLGLLGLAAGAAALAWPTFTSATGLGAPCPTYAVTGVPCPFCGLTTASVALVHGDVAGAAAANPGVLALAALAVAVVPLLALRAAGVLAAPDRLGARARRRVEWSVALLAAASWVFQLNRLVLS